MDPMLLRVRRAALDLTQREVAARVGMSQARYSLIERAEVAATESEQLALHQALTLPSETARVISASVDVFQMA